MILSVLTNTTTATGDNTCGGNSGKERISRETLGQYFNTITDTLIPPTKQASTRQNHGQSEAKEKEKGVKNTGAKTDTKQMSPRGETNLKVVILSLLRGAGELPQEHRQLPHGVRAARLLGF